MATRDIRPSTAHTICDVCGRTLLRGERAEAYIHEGDRRWVCELCKPRALHEGWVLEGTVPTWELVNSSPERRRSLLGRLRKRETPVVSGSPRRLDDELDRDAWLKAHGRAGDGPREPRHVRAIPTSTEHKVAAAIDMFNGSEHVRTVAGVARSLGAPLVSVKPLETPLSLVNIVVAWELCWYRYEVDLSEDAPAVRLAGQGAELDELAPEERAANAAFTEQGLLVLGA